MSSPLAYLKTLDTYMYVKNGPNLPYSRPLIRRPLLGQENSGLLIAVNLYLKVRYIMTLSEIHND